MYLKVRYDKYGKLMLDVISDKTLVGIISTEVDETMVRVIVHDVNNIVYVLETSLDGKDSIQKVV